MKRRLISLLNSIAERSLLTPEEKRVLCFVLVAFLLGMAVKYYRETHLKAAPPVNANFRSDRAAISPPPKKAPKKQRKKIPGAVRPAEAGESSEMNLR